MSSIERGSWASARHRSSVLWVVTIAAIAILFDGYDLVVYGTILPVLMDDPSHIGTLTASQAGALGSYALVGVMVGALTCGAIGDHFGSPKDDAGQHHLVLGRNGTGSVRHQHHHLRSAAVLHRHRCRWVCRHRRSHDCRVRAAGTPQSVQRHRLQRCPGRWRHGFRPGDRSP